MLWPFRARWRLAPTLGEQGERLAAKHLKRHGFRILERNVRLGPNEVDLIAREGDTVVFVEVKTRRACDPVPPEANVGPEKQRRLRRAARIYISRHDDGETYYRFDIVSVCIPEKGRPDVVLFRDAFQGH